MADKAIGDLNFAPGTVDDSNTLFVVQQSGAAYKLSGHEFILALTTILDGHGGIADIEYTAPSSGSLDGTLTITLADQSTTEVTVTNGKSISSITQYFAVNNSSSSVPSSWSTTRQTMTNSNRYLWSYFHFAFNDNTSVDTPKSVIGVYGDTGNSWYIWIRYAGQQPTSDSDIGTTPDKWIGIYSGTASTAPTTYTSYTWYEFKGQKGDTGDSISSIVKTGGTGAPGTVDTYTAYVNTTAIGSFQVYNGSDGQGSPGSQLPVMDGTANAGSAVAYSREDHVHPTDTSRASQIDMNTAQSAISAIEEDVDDLQDDLSIKILKATSPVTPQDTQQTYSLPGLTTNHELIRWNFKDSGTDVAENNPPCDLEWSTGANQWTLIGSTATSVTCQPVFAISE